MLIWNNTEAINEIDFKVSSVYFSKIVAVNAYPNFVVFFLEYYSSYICGWYLMRPSISLHYYYSFYNHHTFEFCFLWNLNYYQTGIENAFEYYKTKISLEMLNFMGNLNNKSKMKKSWHKSNWCSNKVVTRNFSS